ncbi:Uncharacterized protein FWK35_00008286 [Aphis craccivora]|uniref:Uncharacterized protein n=1 Tax=Aphis craccivora TaxID=307492 RepID=A0A6G0YQI6_APHCR|nr:Uncharacterized protein FWK35_00008286 [Aphis craccivora]
MNAYIHRGSTLTLMRNTSQCRAVSVCDIDPALLSKLLSADHDIGKYKVQSQSPSITFSISNGYSINHSKRSDEFIDFIMMCIVYSERSDECIDFTMLCCRNNASISNFGGGFRWQMNLVGTLGSFQKRPEKPKKLRNNGNFYAKPVFDQIDFFI